MTRKPTYAELAQRVKALEEEALKARQVEKTLREAEKESAEVLSLYMASNESMAHSFHRLEKVEKAQNTKAAVDIILEGIQPALGSFKGTVAIIKKEDQSLYVAGAKGEIPPELVVGTVAPACQFQESTQGLCRGDCPLEKASFGATRHCWKLPAGPQWLVAVVIWDLKTSELDHIVQYLRLNASVLYRVMAQEQLHQAKELLEEKLHELKTSEERFETLVVTIPDIVYRINNEGKIVFINNAVRTLGYEPEELIGEHFSVLIHSADIDHVSRDKVLPKYIGKTTGDEAAPKLFDERRTGDRRTSGLEVRLVHKGGPEVQPALIETIGSETVMVEVNSSGMYEFNPHTKNEAYIGTVGVIRDITERKQSEKEVWQALKTAEAANKAKSDFLASMSHELRTPLNAVIGFSEVLKDRYFGDLNPKQDEYVDDITGSGRHLLSLINDVLDIAKVEAGKMDLQCSSIKIKPLLENSLVMIKEEAHKHGIKLELKIAKELDDLEIESDERKLKQVLFNLLSNAAKFTPDGGEIRLEANLISDMDENISRKGAKAQSETNTLYPIPHTGRDFIEISVADSGVGIAPENQKKVFEEFFQIQSGLTNKTPGTGLGLPLSRQMVEMHGGKIWVESAGHGQGSRFSFVLPLETLPLKQSRPESKEDFLFDKVTSEVILLSHLKRIISVSKRHTRSFTLACFLMDMERGQAQNPDVKEILEKEKRGEDFLGQDKNGRMYFIFQDTDQKGATVACNRFAKRLESVSGVAQVPFSIASFPEDGQTPRDLFDNLQAKADPN